MLSDLSGRIAIITGAGRRTGIGYAVARYLTEMGVSTVVTDICRREVPDPEYEAAAWAELVSIAEELRGVGGQHLPMRADVSNPADIDTLLDLTEEKLGPIDILVNNAGILVTKPLLQTTIEEWQNVMRVNALGTFICAKLVALRMVKRGVPGRIVNIASMSAKEGWPNLGVYTASKFAVLGFTQSFARELAPYKINVNAVCPGIITTDMHAQGLERLSKLHDTTPEHIDRAQQKRIPLGRPGAPVDVARVVAFLVSPESTYMTGQALNVTGGLLVH